MASSPIETAIRDELQNYPGVELELKNGGKHNRAVFKFGGESRFVVIPKTPSDWRSAANTKQAVKKTLRELKVPRRAKPDADQKRWHYDATIALQSHALSVTIPSRSKLSTRFANADPRRVWSFELRANPDLQSPPFLVMKASTLAPGQVRARSGAIKGFKTRKGAVLLKMVRPSLPTLLANAPNIKATPLNVVSEKPDELVFRIPEGVIQTGDTPHHDEAQAPLPSVAWSTTRQEPEELRQERGEATTAPEVAKAPSEPVAGLQDRPITLQFPKQSISIEQAIALLNRRKQQLGSGLRFTIEEGGFISAVHRIGK